MMLHRVDRFDDARGLNDERRRETGVRGCVAQRTFGFQLCFGVEASGFTPTSVESDPTPQGSAW